MLSKAVKARREKNRIRHFFHVGASEMEDLCAHHPLPALGDIRAAMKLSNSKPQVLPHLFKQHMRHERRIIPQSELDARREAFRNDVLNGAHTDIHGWPTLTVQQRLNRGMIGEDPLVEHPEQAVLFDFPLNQPKPIGRNLQGVPGMDELQHMAIQAKQDQFADVMVPWEQDEEAGEFDASEMMAMGVSPSDLRLVAMGTPPSEDEDEIPGEENPDDDPGEIPDGAYDEDAN